MLGENCTPRQRQRLRAGRRLERGVIRRPPADLADAIGQFDARMRLGSLRVDRDRRAALRTLALRRALALRLQRFDLLIELAHLGERRAQVVAKFGEADGDRIPGRIPLADVERLGFRRQLFRSRLGESHDHRPFGAQGVNGRPPALLVLARRLVSLASIALSGAAVSVGATSESTAPIVTFADPSPSSLSEAGSSVSGRLLKTRVLSPAGRSTSAMREMIVPASG